jgi:hypothetical protein
MNISPAQKSLAWRILETIDEVRLRWSWKQPRDRHCVERSNPVLGLRIAAAAHAAAQ